MVAEVVAVAVTAAQVEVVVVGKAAVAVEEAEEMAAPVAVVALVSQLGEARREYCPFHTMKQYSGITEHHLEIKT